MTAAVAGAPAGSTRSASRVTARWRRAIGLLALIVLLGIWALLLRPVALGGPATWVVVSGRSMLPTLHSGDLVLVEAGAAQVGDIVAYRVPAGDIGAGHVVIHRLVGGDGTSGYVVQGDGNAAPDPWRPRDADIVGRAWLTVPGLGLLVGWLVQPAVAGALAAALVVFLLASRRTA